MGKRDSGAALTEYEKTVILALLKQRYTNQNIHSLVNIGRAKTINPARIAEVKKRELIFPAELIGDWEKQEIDNFLFKKENHDYKTGLNPVDDSRLIAAREAMCSAVGIFNNPKQLFKTETFCVLANIAWTYLVHEYYVRKGVSLIRGDGRTEALSDLIKSPDCPLSQGIKNNLSSLKEIRDSVEHKLPDIKVENHYNSLYQACCLNFNKTLVNWFGEKCSLQKELSIALQFAKHDIQGVSQLQQYNLPANIAALDAQVYGKLTEKELNDLEFQFKVVYIKVNASKGAADMAVQFIPSDSAEGVEINNILLKPEVSDTLYPFKPSIVCKKVTAATGEKYTISSHTKAYKKHKIRPAGSKSVPAARTVNKKYCHYDKAHKDYLYNQAWIDLLIEEEKCKTRL